MSGCFPMYPPRLTGGYYLQRGREKLENCLLYDWFSCTLPLDGLYFDEYGEDLSTGQVFIDLLGLNDVSFLCLSGVRGYSKKLWFDGINIHLPSESHNEVWLEMSGSGCRAFETYGHSSWEQLFKFASVYCHITRLDVSFDDHTGILDINTIVQDTFRFHNYVSRCSKHKLEMEMDDKASGNACTIYHGSRQSDIMIRIYDKAAQLNRFDHWIRIEIEFHRDRAAAFITLISMGGSLGHHWSSVLLNYLRYVEPSDDSNMWRWPLKSYWSDLVGAASPLRLYSAPGVEYNLERVDSFVFGQAGNSIRTYIEIFGLDKFLSRLKETQPVITPDKYKSLVERFKVHDEK